MAEVGIAPSDMAEALLPHATSWGGRQVPPGWKCTLGGSSGDILKQESSWRLSDPRGWLFWSKGR